MSRQGKLTFWQRLSRHASNMTPRREPRNRAERRAQIRNRPLRQAPNYQLKRLMF